MIDKFAFCNFSETITLGSAPFVHAQEGQCASVARAMRGGIIKSSRVGDLVMNSGSNLSNPQKGLTIDLIWFGPHQILCICLKANVVTVFQGSEPRVRGALGCHVRRPLGIPISAM